MPPNPREPIGSPSAGLHGESESLSRDIDRLAEPIRAVLSTAAVIGDEFEVSILAAATGLGSDQLRGHLAELVRAGIIQRIDDDKYRFGDQTARKAIYDGLEAARRSRSHRQIGEAIEQIYGTDSDTHVEELAHHFSQGISPDTSRKPIQYLIAAGTKVHSIYAYERAGIYWRAALKLLSSSKGDADLRADALLRLNDERVSSGPEAVAYLEQAITALESLKAKSWIGYAHLRLGYFFSGPQTGAELSLPLAMVHFDKAELLLQAAEDRAKLAELLQYKCGACNLTMQTELGLKSGQRAMELCEQIGDEFRWTITAALTTRHLLASGRLTEALALAQKASDRAKDFEDPFSGSTTAFMEGLISSDLLDNGAARDRYLAELARQRTARSVQRQILQTEAAHMYKFSGELDQSRRMLEQVRGPGASTALPFEDGDWERTVSDVLEKMNLARTNGNTDWISLRSHWLGIVYRVAGKWEEAERSQLESLRINQAAPNLARVLWAAPDLCLLYFDMGRREDARRLLADCHSILARGEDWRASEGVVMRAQAAVSALERRFINADAEFEKAIGIFRRFHNRWHEADAFVYWGRALIAAGDKRRAKEKLEQSLEIYRQIGAGQAWIDRVNETRSKAGVTIAAPMEFGTASTPCSFVREGAIWSISHRNRTFRIKDMKGLRYIAHLLAHPGEEFHVLDLITAIDGVANTGSRETNQNLRITNDLGDAGEILDRRSKMEYRHRRDDLRAELDDAEAANDRGRTQRIRAELEMIDEQLASSMGLGGRDRKAADHSERARDRIRKSIHKSLASIRENDPSLGHHLTTCIRTGYLCSYYPDPAIR